MNLVPRVVAPVLVGIAAIAAACSSQVPTATPTSAPTAIQGDPQQLNVRDGFLLRPRRVLGYEISPREGDYPVFKMNGSECMLFFLGEHIKDDGCNGSVDNYFNGELYYTGPAIENAQQVYNEVLENMGV